MIRNGGVTLLGGLMVVASVFPLVAQNQPAAANAQSVKTLLAAAEPAIAEKLIARGDELFKLGDVAAARLLYERAAHEGSARAGTAVGRTYDPYYLEATGLMAAAADPVRAMRWYRKAAASGDEEAERRLKALSEWLQLESAKNATDAIVAARYAVIMEARRLAAADRRQAAEESRRQAAKEREAAEKRRRAAERAEQERQAAEAAEKERQAAELAEEKRRAAERAERERQAARAAEQKRAAAEAAETEGQAGEAAVYETAAGSDESLDESAAADTAESEAAPSAEQQIAAGLAVEKAAAERAAAESAAAEAAEQQAAADQAAADRAIAAKRAAERRARLEAEEAAREFDSEKEAAEKEAAGWAAAGQAEQQAAAERAAAASEEDLTTTEQIANAEPAAGGAAGPTASPEAAEQDVPPEVDAAVDGSPASESVEPLPDGSQWEGEEGDSVAALIERQRATATPGPGSQTANRPTAAPWQTTEDGVRYRVEDGPNGFFVSVYHAPLNIIPDTAEIELECRKAVSDMARRVATDYGRPVRPIEDERIRTTTWRNTIDIRTRCIGTTLVEYRD